VSEGYLFQFIPTRHLYVQKSSVLCNGQLIPTKLLLGDEIHVIPDPLFALPTDGAFILTIETSDSGRIFLGAKDGCLYEVTYTVSTIYLSFQEEKLIISIDLKNKAIG